MNKKIMIFINNKAVFKAVLDFEAGIIQVFDIDNNLLVERSSLTPLQINRMKNRIENLMEDKRLKDIFRFL
jgi:hypothetical protein